MSELVSKELFNQFQDSSWPEQFSAMAQTASGEDVTVDELEFFTNHEVGLILVPKEEQQMLEDMGIIEYRLAQWGYVTPSMVQDGFRGDPNTYRPHYSELGKQVIMACENLYTPEEHAAAAESARPELDLLVAELNSEFGKE